MFRSLTLIPALLLLIIMGFANQAVAQNEVLVRVFVLPPYPMNLQEMIARQNETFLELQNTTTRELEVELRVRVFSDDTGIEVRTDPNRSTGLPIVLPPNAVVRLNGSELPDYFNTANVLYKGITEAQLRNTRALPEGYYFVCGQVVDANSKIQLSQEVCSAPIALMALEPPQLRLTNPLAGNDTLIQTLPQNLIFQWNVPSNVPARDISQLEYTLYLAEVPEGIEPQTVIAAAPANSPGFTVLGTNLYVYGPAAPQLLLGQRYVATLVARHIDEALTFRNAGRSVPITFVFGSEPIDSIPEPLGPGVVTTTAPITEGTITGQVRWAYRDGEQPNPSSGSSEPLLITDPSNLITSRAQTAPASQQLATPGFVLPHARVRLLLKPRTSSSSGGYRPYYSRSSSRKSSGETLATTVADAEGRFAFNDVLPMHLNDPRLSVEVEAGPQFVKQMVSLTDATSTGSLSFDFAEITLPAYTFRLTTQVLAENLAPGATVTAQILARSSLVSRQPYVLGGLPGASGEEVIFNSESWRVIATITSGDQLRGIFHPAYRHEQLVLRAITSTGASTAVPLTLAPASDFNPYLPPITLSYQRSVELESPGFAISGIVRHNGNARQGAKVSVVYTDEVSGQQLTTSPVFTDPSGFYQIDSLAFLTQVDAYKVVCSDSRLSPKPDTIVTEWTSGTEVAQVDFDLKSIVYVAAGRIVDQHGSPIANARVSSNNFVTFTSDEGVFVVRYTAYAEPLSIEAPNINLEWKYTPDLPTSVAEPFGATEWVAALQSLQVAQDASTLPTDGGFFGLNPGPLEQTFRTSIDAGETLAGFDDLGDVPVQNFDPTLILHARLNAEYVDALVTLSDTIQLRTSGEGSLVWSGPPGTYMLRIMPSQAGPRFLPYFDEVVLNAPIINSLSSNQTRLASQSVELTVNLMPAVAVNGIVTDSTTRLPIAGAQVQVEGLPYSDTTDASGAYELLLIRNREVQLVISADGYNTERSRQTFEEDGQLNISLLARDSTAPDIRTISGFPVVLEKLAPGTSPDVYVLSGTMSIAGAGNGLYSVSPGTEQITFVDAQVKMLNDTIAIPHGPMALDVATLSTDAFGFAPIDLMGSPTIELRAIAGSTFSERRTAVIGGPSLMLNMTRFGSIGGIPMSSMPSAHVSNDLYSYASSGIDTAAVKNVVGTQILLGSMEFQGVFASPGKALAYMSRSATFSLVFAKDAPNFTVIKLKKKSKPADSTAVLPFVKPTDATHMKGSIAGGLLKLHIDKEEASVDSSGIHFAGFLELPEVPSVKWPNQGFLRLSAFDIIGGGVVNKLAVEIDADKPLRNKVGKWMMQLDRIIIRGLGSPNVGLGAGGLVILKREEDNSVKAEDNLQIKELSFVLGSNGPTMIGELLFPVMGLAIGKLRTTTSRPVSLKLETAPVSLSFDGGGTIYYADNTTMVRNPDGSVTPSYSTTGVVGKIFPLTIDRFIFRSADWSVFMASSPDKSIDLKAVTLKLSKLLINIGVGMTMDQMSEYMELTKADKSFDPNKRAFIGTSPEILAYAQDRVDRAVNAGRTPNAMDKAMLDDAILRGKVTAAQLRALVAQGSSSDALLSTSQMSWAIGLGGTVEFPVKDLNSKAGGSILLAGGGGNGFQVRVNELFLEANSPAFHLSVSAKMQFGAKKWGMEGAGEMETLTKKFAASFKFYHHNDPANNMVGIEVGASILASLGVTTGPVMWHTIGGGFDFNTATQKYKVMALGEIGPAGTPKEVVYAKEVKLEVMFDARNCGPIPIVTGTAGLSLKNEDWGSVAAKLDFCRLYLSLEVETTKSLLSGAANFAVRGTLFAQAPIPSKSQGGVFLGVNAYTSFGTIARGNFLVALGINMDRDGTNTPASVRNMWPKIHESALEGPYDNKLHGIYVGGDLKLNRQQGSITVPIGGFKAVDFSYDVNADGVGNFYTSFSRPKLTLEAYVNGSVDASLTLLSLITLNGEVDIAADLSGGYNTTAGWFVKGSANAYFEVYDNKSTNCNSTAVKWIEVNCRNISYWCGKPPFGWKKKCYYWGCDKVPQTTYRFCVNLKGSFDLSQQRQKLKFAVN